MSETALNSTNIVNNNNRNAILRPYVKFSTRASAAGPPMAEQWDVRALCEAYQWPSDLAGGGVIAIIELGGGWKRADLAAFCARNAIPLPSITDISVDGTRGAYGVDADADAEVALDIQVAAAAYSVATGEPAEIRLYWARDLAPALRTAIGDGCDVCSISWGSDEANWG
jgi:hypothetical protein